MQLHPSALLRVRSGPKFLATLLAQHDVLHPHGLAADERLMKRCNGQRELDELMHYCWAPAIEEARRWNESQDVNLAGVVHRPWSRASHSWSKVIRGLQRLRSDNSGGLFIATPDPGVSACQEQLESFHGTAARCYHLNFGAAPLSELFCSRHFFPRNDGTKNETRYRVCKLNDAGTACTAGLECAVAGSSECPMCQPSVNFTAI